MGWCKLDKLIIILFLFVASFAGTTTDTLKSTKMIRGVKEILSDTTSSVSSITGALIVPGVGIGHGKINVDSLFKTPLVSINDSDGVNMSGNSTVWNDLQFQISSGRVSAANYPNWETFTTNTSEYSFAVDDYIDLAANETPHGWDSTTSGYAHLHVALKAANTSGANRYAKFQVFLAKAKSGGVWADTTLTGELTIPDGTAALTKIYVSMGTVLLSGYGLSSHLKPRVKRIVATGGTEYSGSIFIEQFGIHVAENKIGSMGENKK
jgi:hypothetical protein